jgi:hypothetical protein
MEGMVVRGNRVWLIIIGVLVLVLAHTEVGRELLLPEAEAERQAKRIARLKKKAAGFGIGKKAWVVVRLIDGTWLQGYIKDIRGDFLELISWQQDSIICVNFSEVKQIT